MVTRRAVLAAGTAVAAVAAVSGGVGVALHRPALELSAAALRPLVGSRFRVDGRAVRLTAVEPRGSGGGAFRLAFTADAPLDLPGGVRTFAHADGDLVLHAGPVGAAGTTLEAVVDTGRAPATTATRGRG